MHRSATFCKVIEVDRQQTYKNCTTDFVEYFQYSQISFADHLCGSGLNDKCLQTKK